MDSHAHSQDPERSQVRKKGGKPHAEQLPLAEMQLALILKLFLFFFLFVQQEISPVFAKSERLQ